MAVKSVPQAETKRRARSMTRGRKVWKWLKIGFFSLLGLTLVAFIAGAIIGYPIYVWAEKQVAKIDSISENFAFEPTVIYSRDMKVLYRAQAEYRKPVRYDEVPDHVVYATLAAEDERFFDHVGVDPKSVVRAVFENVSEQKTSQGASTITMQLAKRLYTSPEKAFVRKLKDAMLAFHIEKKKTKEEILKLYLNEVYYGAGAYGISAAADVYFGKDLEELSIAEAALLARLVQRPTDYNPFRNLDVAIEKRDVVLHKMRELGWITEPELHASLNEDVKLRRSAHASGEKILDSPWFTYWVLDTIARRYPEYDIRQGGFRIETTLDPNLQDFAEEEVRRVVRQNQWAGVTTGAFVVMNAKGEVLAMVGGANYSKNQYNVVWQGKRQPGSAMKPFVFAAALSTGALGQWDSISNEPHYIANPNGPGRILWPRGGGRGGHVSIPTALALSINVPAVRVIEKVGPRTAVRYAHNAFGFTSRLDPVPAMVLGSSAVSPLELAEGFSVFMLYGDRAEPFGIRRVICPDGRILDDFGPDIKKNVLDASVASYMDGCLRGVVTGGTGKEASGIPNARGKTGTTSDHRDAWFCGYTNNFVGIAWVANEQFRNGRAYYPPMNGVFGGEVSVDIWRNVMRRVITKFDDSQRHTKGRSRARTLYGREPEERIHEDTPIPDNNEEEIFPTVPEPDASPPDENPNTATEPGTKPATEPTQPPAEPQPQPKPPNPDPPPADDPMESIEICSASGMRANPYCASTLTQQLSRSKIPRRCTMHGPHR